MNRKAFTLVELSIVIAIIGMLLVGGSSGMQWLTKLTQKIESTDIIDAKKDSIISFGTNAKVLPNATQILSLGNQNKDIWQNDLVYYSDTTLESTDALCNQQSTTLSVVRCSDLECLTPIQTINNVAFALVSDGYNSVSQTSLVSNSLNVYENNVVADGFEYDDIVSWMTLDELRVRVFCNRERLKILNNELPYGYAGTTYTTTIYPKGGIPYASDKFQWSYSFSPSLTCTDNLDVNNSATNLQLTCTNPSSNTHLVSITVSDDDFSTYTKEYVLNINH